jgi:dihydrofolate reductase
MRKLKLQMQMTIDGFVAGPDGQLDWMTWKWDEELTAFVNKLTDASDTILLGRKMTPGFITHWEKASTQPASEDFAFANKMVSMSKVVFSRTLTAVDGRNVRVEASPLADAVNRLKAAQGKDIVVYGGASFVSSLIEQGLIDEFNLFINPVAIGHGLRVFTSRTPLKLTASVAYQCGVVVNTYRTA